MTQADKYIYVVLTQTGTVPARIIKFFTKAPYNHASISSDIELQGLYSFCRKFKSRPLPAGFVEEKGVGVFDMFQSIPCEIYAFKVTDEQYEKYNSIITHFKLSNETYSYNIIGLLALIFGFSIHRKKHFICSQFVAHILEECDIAHFYKDSCLVKPDDFRYLEKAKLVYKGDMKELPPFSFHRESHAK